MNDFLKIENIHPFGYVANANPRRASRDGKEFEGLLPAPTWSDEVVKRNGTVTDTVHEMGKLIRRYAWQTEKLAPKLKGRNTYETCRNIWNFLYEHIKYKEDDDGKEQLRTPALSWAVRLTRGIDCDDFTLFAGCLMYNLKLNIPFYIRIARYPKKDYFQHVYPVIPLKDHKYITLDAVLDEYDSEKPTAETKDFLIMNTSNLNGIDISVLGGVDDDTANEISGILSGEDFKEVSELEGLGSVAPREQELQAIKNHLLRTRRIIAARPHLIKEVEHPQTFLGMVDYALKYWDTDKRGQALDALSGEEDRMNDLEGMRGYHETHEDVDLFYGLNGLGAYDVLGKAKKSRKFFDKVKSAVKKAGQGIKKVAKGLIRFNPLTVTIRAAVLLALKVNLLKVSSKLKWGYLTEDEAKTKGFNMDEWRKVKKQLSVAENMFVKVLQGKAENFKRAILNGRAGKLSGASVDLGFVVAAGTAASTTAAVPFITKILNLLKKINYKKLLETVSSLKLKKKATAEQSDNVTEDGESAQPEGGETSDGGSGDDGGSDAGTDDNAQDAGGDGSEAEAAGDDSGGGEPAPDEGAEDPGEDNSQTLTKSLRAAKAEPPSAAAEAGFFAKAMTWVKENPTTSILIAGGAAFLLYEAFAPKGKTHALSGVRRGKKKKGKAKNNPPHAISGTHHRKQLPPKRIKL